MTGMGGYNLILEWLKEYQDILKFKNKTDSKSLTAALSMHFGRQLSPENNGK